MHERYDFCVSVVIPVKNGAEYIDEVLQSVFSQTCNFDYEVIVIDSGSTDRSLEILKEYDVKLIQIKPEKFNHGLTRNFGVENSQGKFIAFLTQDATPVNDRWLQNIVDPFLENPNIAGVFGKHLPRENCDPIVAIGLQRHFDLNISTNRKYWKKDNEYENNRGVYIFFSNNNSCIRKSVWEKIPFREVEMSEDQWWAQDILDSGYLKFYEPDALVYHSHNYFFIEWFQRQFDEYREYTRIGVVNRASFYNACKSFIGLCVKDTNQLLKISEIPALKKINWILVRILNNLGMVSGQFCGSRYDMIPTVVVEKILSQQSQRINNR